MIFILTLLSSHSFFQDKLYISDAFNHVIRMINLSTMIISTIAGTGTQGASGDGGLATSARMTGPVAICFDSLGNLFISDLGNFRVRVINTTGYIDTYAGNGTTSYVNGSLATQTGIAGTSGLAFDVNNNLYIGGIYLPGKS